jgi:hypothetical protein
MTSIGFHHLLSIYLFCFSQMKRVMQKDAARTEDVVPYNIIPLDSLTSTTNAIVNFPEVIVHHKSFFYWQFAGSGGGYTYGLF